MLVPPESSEWLEGVEAGSLILVGSDTERIHSVALRLLADAPAREAMTAGRNPFGDGHAAPRVGQALEHLIFNTAPDPYRVAFGRERVLEASGFDPEEIAPTSSKIAAAHPEVVSGSTVTARFAALRRQGAAGGLQGARGVLGPATGAVTPDPFPRVLRACSRPGSGRQGECAVASRNATAAALGGDPSRLLRRWGFAMINIPNPATVVLWGVTTATDSRALGVTTATDSRALGVTTATDSRALGWQRRGIHDARHRRLRACDGQAAPADATRGRPGVDRPLAGV
ncbi:MAG TPA: UDP-N-acetylglucosamine 2-epimerase, partial [Actinomycetota bacterium]|nr:UDP-N-acetylglucosamine 2-epimerase [Actinomycetota bacterium]